MRVLLISHTCQSRAEGQPKALQMARAGEIELCVLVPDRWMHYGAWRAADAPQSPPYKFVAGRVRWPWTGPGQFYLHWYPELARLLRDFQPDIIDLWEEPWGLVSAHACRLRNQILPACKIVIETEQNIEKRLPPPFETLRSYTLRNADFAVGRSAEAVSVLRRKGYQGTAEVVPNAVDIEMFRPLDRETCRRRLGIHRFTVGYVGRLVEEKGIGDLMEALPLCRPGTDLLFVGAGSMKELLLKLAQELGRSESVRFLDSQPVEALPEIMNAIDVLALPSRTTPRWKEQYGRVIIEAHACGTAVVGSDSGAIPAVIGAAGLVVPERNPAALSGAIDVLHCDPERSREMGRLGRLRVEAECSWERVAEKMLSIYGRMLEETQAAA